MIGIILLISAIVLGICLIFGGYVLGIYNTIIKGKNDYEGQWANIKTEYQKRFDLFLNLSTSVKSHKIFEKDTLIEVTKARSSIGNIQTNDIKSLGKMDSLLSGLKINIEAYPQLKSDKLYMKLMESIDETEECVLSSRGELNAIARDFNTYIQTFPVSIFANLFKAKNLEYFKEQTKEANEPPVIDV